jgi:polygalacturonase
MLKLNSFSFLYINVLIGENGTIDGQGDAWWNMWRNRTLQFTRPNLVEFVNSKDIVISNVIFKDSPFWNIHPVYCRYMSNISHLSKDYFTSISQ